ncbi:helix-turn-helix transcriptional regulator [Reticulibacter mediterranei]|uniref:helix-turn-helix transcriptional regulator n=1 Tax=Reticulibacter mediterranei TaxID=2778369 RepID=UPI001C690CDE|nr:helix-turn-helix transcriptional regulator [Reticulibacter mediterranei]
MYELLVLALLMRWPLHAYFIADITNSIIGPWEKISRGSLSGLLAKLESRGMIEPGDPAQVPFPPTRSARVFAITAAGRKRFFQLMMDTTSNPGNYQRIFRLKALHLEFLPLKDQLFLVDHYLYYCQTAAHYMREEAEDMRGSDMKHETSSEWLTMTALTLMATAQEQWELEREWAQQLRERIIAAQISGETTTLS